MTTDQEYENLGRFVMAYLRAGDIQRRVAGEALGLIQRMESPEAGAPWSRPYAPPEGIAEAEEAGE